MSSLGMTMKGLSEVAIINTGTGETPMHQREMFGFKLWQLGLLVGVPSAMAIFYFYYNKSDAASSSETSKDIKNTKSATGKSSAQKPSKKKPEDMVNILYFQL